MFENQILVDGKEEVLPDFVGQVEQDFGRTLAHAQHVGEVWSLADSGSELRLNETLGHLEAGVEGSDGVAIPGSDNCVGSHRQDWHSGKEST